MKTGYLFISNGTKPTKEAADSLDPIAPGSFSKAAIWAADKMGWELHMGIDRNHPEQVESLGYDIKFYNQHCYRNIFALRDNWRAYRNLCRYLRLNPQIKIIHCNTPIGGVVGRLAGHKYGLKVIYMAHGFHFFKGAPLFNRTILKWVERWLARHTDILITINREDYEAAQKFKLKKGGEVAYVPGVGIDLSSFMAPQNKKEKLRELGIPENAFICIGIGDVIKRKNYKTAIEAISLLQNPNVHFIICGVGPEIGPLEELAKQNGISDRIHFLGFRKDVKDLLYSSDAFLFSSLQEGLPRSTMEAMAAGLPCVVSDIRGNRDLIDDGKGGFLVPPTDASAYARAITKLIEDAKLRDSMSAYNQSAIKNFSLDKVQQELLSIFETI